MKKVELLAPAGDIERLKFAYLYGADACYIGGRDFSLRANATNFSIEQIKEASLIAHKMNKKLYVTVNIVFQNEDFDGLVEYLKELENAKVDAIIVSDPSVIEIVKNNNINLNIHISTQYSSSNTEVVNFFKSLGCERVVLSRELSKNEIKEIIDKRNIDIEVFLHGAMCSSYSGRCILSNYFTNRDANRGGCAQICRWDFDLYDNDKLIESDTKFTMSCKDLSMIEYLPDMIDIGIASLKVEGRMRSNYYIATVINTYRSAIDDYYSNNLTKDKILYYKSILDRVANRDSICQFFNKFPGVDEQYFLGRMEVSNQDYLALVLDYNKDTKIATITQRNYFKKGDTVEIFGPNIKTFKYKINEIYDINNNPINIANHPEQILKIKIDKEIYKDDILRVYYEK